jgi:uncharacterized protein YhaN
MRLLELVFERYGPFTDVRLHFDPEARVHIVYGANEAGKSCALAGLGDFFYGPPRRAELGFLRPRDLRIGAKMQGRNGQILQCVRKRGDKNTLLDPSGAALPEDALAPFLRADREIFQRAFGLNADSLRKGGDEMLQSDGEIGASLLTAASGLRNLVTLKQNFETKAAEIFTDRKAGHRSFYQALEKFEAARDQERAATLHESTLKSLKSEMAGAREKIDAIEAARKIAQGEKQRLARLLKTAPIVKTLARLRGDYAAMDDLAALPSDWARECARLLQAEAQGAEATARAAEAHESARLDADIVVDEPLLAQAAKIEALIRASGAYEKAAADLPRRELALRDARETLRRRAQDCGLPDAASLRAAAPNAATLQRAEKLCAKGRDLDARQHEPRRALQEEEAAFARLRAEQPPGPAQDPNALREKFTSLGPIAHWDAAFREAELAASEAARALAEKCARLLPALADLDTFAREPSPDAAFIAQAARMFDARDQREQAARQKRDEARSAQDAAQRTLANLERQGAAPSLEALRTARGERDAEWAGLGAFLRGEALGPAPGDALWTSRTQVFSHLLAEADRRADALLADSARAAAADAARSTIADAQRAAAEAEKLLAALAAERTHENRAWAQAWAPCGVAPLAPREMAAWRSRADALLEEREALAAQKAKARAWEERLEDSRPHLESLATECGLAPLEKMDSAALARRIETRLSELAKAQDAARAAQARLADAPHRISRLKERLAQWGEEHARWDEDWRAELAALRLDPDAGFDEAQKRIALWRALPGEIEDETDKALRAQKIAADLTDFEQALDALLAGCAPDMSSRPVEAAVAQLRDRLTRAREKAALRLKARERFEAAEAAAQKAEAELAQTRESLDTLRESARKAGLDGALEALLARCGAREKLGEAIKAERERLFLVADGCDEAALAEEAEAFDPDAARGKLDDLEREMKIEEDRAREIFAGLRAAENRWTGLQEALGAESAIQAKESARAEILEDSRRWAVLKLAALLLEAGLERSRERNKDPLIARAGELFSTLTLGRYAGLETFGEEDGVHLLARRAGGEALELAALSEGARDQLYLALRLAFLENYARNGDAPPFIGDDLFASFDDSRAAAGLQALADAGAFLQPILFTHHRHIVDIARATLAERAQIIDLA